MLQSESVIKSVGALFKKNCYLYCFSTVLYVVVDILVPEVVQTLTRKSIHLYMWTYMKNDDDSLFLTFDFFLFSSYWSMSGFLLRWSFNVECEGSNEYIWSLNVLFTVTFFKGCLRGRKIQQSIDLCEFKLKFHTHSAET